MNLQRGGHLMVNYDLPWNPNRIEQRFGESTGSGRSRSATCGTSWRARRAKGAVYERLLEKLETARESSEGRSTTCWERLFEGRPLRELFIEAIRYGEKPQVRERLFEAVDGAVDVDHINSLVSRNKLTREGLDPATVQGVGRRWSGPRRDDFNPITSARSSRPRSSRPAACCEFARKDGRKSPACRRACAIATGSSDGAIRCCRDTAGSASTRNRSRDGRKRCWLHRATRCSMRWWTSRLNATASCSPEARSSSTRTISTRTCRCL